MALYFIIDIFYTELQLHDPSMGRQVYGLLKTDLKVSNSWKIFSNYKSVFFLLHWIRKFQLFLSYENLYQILYALEPLNHNMWLKKD